VSGLTILFVVLGVVLIVPLYSFGVRRLLGLRLSPLRALIGGIVALACASPIITAIGGSIAKHNGKWPFLPALWFVILGVAIALLVGMLVVVILEALAPSGTMPGPLYLIRALRKRTRRVRRYSQIGRILLRRGMLPYLRGARRAELQTREGRVALARSLRRALEDGGVTFVKLGQVLATRRDLLPAEFVDELSGLQDNAPPVPWPEVEQVLRAGLGAEVDDVFESFERTPLAAHRSLRCTRRRSAPGSGSSSRFADRASRRSSPGIWTSSIDWRGVCSAQRAGVGEWGRLTSPMGSPKRSARSLT